MFTAFTSMRRSIPIGDKSINNRSLSEIKHSFFGTMKLKSEYSLHNEIES